ncbi:hypothetical protein H6F90_21670 [Trichocoleus sp. FACHB-591]|uniref:hypothetical protein n=1 Tax=Trichocoleus sp. FACHB-591 TaxID=2692872 RepID=UPI0016856F57|nr:hypothetical protein [Trichocoleus sp. FACHB-591]MBD2097708.1 hypothetical protein [Trichocoleus sp. FACHB-591]
MELLHGGSSIPSLYAFGQIKLCLIYQKEGVALTVNSSRKTKRAEPLPLSPLGRRLCETFPYLWQAILGVNEPDPQWQTITKHPIRPRVLWRLWQDSAQLIGVRFSGQTRYGIIDIDYESLYHPTQDSEAVKALRTALETIGLYRSILVRSSWSEGLHLYIPLPEEVPTFGLASALKQCLEAQGFIVKPGQLEIFPNCKAYALPGTYTEYNAHRLPLQPASGSCLLDNDYNPISDDLESFFQQWDTAAAGQALEELRSAIATARANRKTKRHRSNIVGDWQQDLLGDIQEGWTGHGQTNHLLKTIACYGVVFEGLTAEALAKHVHQTAISSPGYQQWCRHQHEITLRSQVWARAAEGYYWPLGSSPKRLGTLHSDGNNNVVPFNLARSEDAQQRIKAAFKHLEEQKQLPPNATARAKAIAQQGGVSTKTLYRYLELWHPSHQSDYENETCKIPDSETVLASFATSEAKSTELSKPVEDKEFYTYKKFMKGWACESVLANFLSVYPHHSSRRDLLTESVTTVEGTDASQELMPESLDDLTGTIGSFPQEQLVDFASVLASIDVEVLRLSWDTFQFQNFLESTYGKSSRSLLSDCELMDLFSRLRTILSVSSG